MAAKLYTAGDAIRVTATIKDSAGELYSPPGGVLITIMGPCGDTVVDAQDMIESSTGNWYFVWQSLVNDELGFYDVFIEASSGSPAEPIGRKRVSALQLVKAVA